jgi:hypothetical protein
VGGCATIRDGFFEDLANVLIGGAIYITNYTSLSVTDCTFHNLHATGPTSKGGACAVGASNLEIARCCGLTCDSEGDGQFMFIYGDAACTSGDVSELSVILCGQLRHTFEGIAFRYGTIYLEAPTAADYLRLNISKCIVYYDGAAFFSGPAPAGCPLYALRYMNVYNCSFAFSILKNGRLGRPTIDFANFYENSPESDRQHPAYILTGAGMIVKHTIFVRNRRSDVTFVSHQNATRWVFEDCYFANATPAPAAATTTRCHNTETASHWIFALGTHYCPGRSNLFSPSNNGAESPGPPISRWISDSALAGAVTPAGSLSCPLPWKTAVFTASASDLPRSPRVKASFFLVSAAARLAPSDAAPDTFLAHTNVFAAISPGADAGVAGGTPAWMWPVIAVAILAVVAASVLAFCLAHRREPATYGSDELEPEPIRQPSWSEIDESGYLGVYANPLGTGDVEITTDDPRTVLESEESSEDVEIEGGEVEL